MVRLFVRLCVAVALRRLLAYGAFVAANEETAVGGHLWLDVMPVKASEPLLPLAMETCVEIESSVRDCGDLVFTLKVDDIIPANSHLRRSGRTSTDRGKQSLNFRIENTQNGDMIRSKKNLKSGTSIIEIFSRGFNTFTICFINLSYDSSWQAVDTVKSVDIQLTTNDFYSKNAYLEELKREIKNGTLHTLQNDASTGDTALQAQSLKELVEIERVRRDINEKVFSRLLYSQLAFVTVLLASQLLVVSYLMKKIKRKSHFPLA